MAAPTEDSQSHQPRAYQLEMFQESLQQNIVVAMDTGSGKTTVAILRIQEALKSPEAVGRLVWFLCPSVALARQQFKVMESQLSGLSSRLIIGEDNVDHWSTQKIWDAVFHNRNIVVSTYQVLHDALEHGFVTMDRLVLLVIDEAHHCFGKSSLNKIMQNFYQPTKKVGGLVPHILGLTASPILRNNINEMSEVERNLDAICRSPRVSREDLLRYVYRPKLIFTPYEKSQADACGGDYWTIRLTDAYEAIDMEQEPWVKKLRLERPDDYEQLLKAIVKRKTYTCEQIRSIKSSVEELSRELGPWASRYYTTLCYQEILSQIEQPGGDPFHTSELKFLADFFRSIEAPLQTEVLPPEDDQISPKVLELLSLLPNQLTEGSAGIIFAKTRATVYLLAKLLSHSHNKHLIRLGTFVGQSGFHGRTNNIGEAALKTPQKSNLEDLRMGYKNLIVATNACEEGIDISACNFVVCFDNPPNLKSFIQRRGRARAKDSKYIIMHEKFGPALKNDWIRLEEEMIQKYTDHLRELQELEELEASEDAHRELQVESTSARIDLHDAVSHLAHFCQKLPLVAFTDARPLYTFLGLEGGIICTVVLPVCMDASLRIFQSSKAWETERLAKRDAAFEAYSALYDAGLVNEHLLPEPILDESTKRILKDVDKRDRTVFVAPQLDPMRLLAQAWENTELIHLYSVRFNHSVNGGLRGAINVNESMLLGLPVKLAGIQPFRIYWDQETIWSVHIVFHASKPCNDLLNLANSATDILLRSNFEPRMGSQSEEETYPVLFFPQKELDDLEQWTKKVGQRTPALEILPHWHPEDHTGEFVVRRINQINRAFEYCGTDDRMVEVPPDYANKEMRQCFVGNKLPKRTDFLHPIPEKQAPLRIIETFSPVDSSAIQHLSLSHVRFALLIPSLMHQVGRSLIAQEFQCSTKLPIYNIGLLLEALTVSSSREASSYQRLEFLGDAILGYYTSLRLMMQNPKWHEGYLTKAKSHAVSNAYLHQAFMDLDVARFVMTDIFTGAKWTPLTNRKLHESGEQEKQQRIISTKTTADVIEALLGAADRYKNSEADVLALLNFCMPYVEWLPAFQYVEKLQSFMDETITLPQHLITLENLIGYHFNLPALIVEALTHPSHVFTSSTSSYQRFEFLGDSILQILVTRYIVSNSDLAENRMHLIRTAAVNNNFLAFLALKHSILIEQNKLKRKSIDDTKEYDTEDSEMLGFEAETVQEKRTLHQFVIHAPSYAMAEATSATISRFQQLEPEITGALETGQSYPWALLSVFGPEKFFGDVVESVICALFLDSSGSEEVCIEYLRKLGMWAFLDRAIATDMHIMQPKEELGIAANQEKVTYDTEPDGDGFVSKVSVGDRLVATASGRQRVEAETLAAVKGIMALRKTGNVV